MIAAANECERTQRESQRPHRGKQRYMKGAGRRVKVMLAVWMWDMPLSLWLLCSFNKSRLQSTVTPASALGSPTLALGNGVTNMPGLTAYAFLHSCDFPNSISRQ